MIAADEFHTAVRDVVVSIFRTDEVVVLHFQSVFLPAAGFSDNMKKWQVTFRAIRKMYFIHVEILPFKLITSMCYCGNITLLCTRQPAQFASPLCRNFFSFLCAELVGYRKAIAPWNGLASVDEHAAHREVASIAFVRRQAWVKVGGPRFENLNRLRRIHSSAQCPDHLFQIHWIDIVVYGHIVAIHAGAGLRACHCGEGVHGVTGVPLFERYNHHQSMTVAPNALDIGDAGLFEVVPDAVREERDTVTLGDRKEWWVAEQDRVLAMQDSLYPNDTFFAAVCVIARPLAEGSLHLRLFFRWRYLTLDDNFRSRGHRKSGKRSPYHFHRLAAQRAGVVVLAHPSLGRRWCRGPSRWLTAQNNRDGTRALCLPVFSRYLLAVFMVNDP